MCVGFWPWRNSNRPKGQTCNIAVPLEYIPFLSENDGRGIGRIGNYF